jgi:hypothetical protein
LPKNEFQLIVRREMSLIRQETISYCPVKCRT